MKVKVLGNTTIKGVGDVTRVYLGLCPLPVYFVLVAF